MTRLAEFPRARSRFGIRHPTWLCSCYMPVYSEARRSKSSRSPSTIYIHSIILTMADRPSSRRTFSATNMPRTMAYRPHEGKFGIVTGGSRGTSRLYYRPDSFHKHFLICCRYWSSHSSQPCLQRLFSSARLYLRLLHRTHASSLQRTRSRT